MVQDSPSRKLDQYIVRFPDGMRDRIKDAAAQNGRSMNAEIIHRLQITLEMDAYEPGPNVHADEQMLSREPTAYDQQLADSTRSLLDALEGVRSEVKETALLTRLVLEAAFENDGKIPDEFLPRARALITQEIRGDK